MTEILDLLAASRRNIDELDDPTHLRDMASQVAQLAQERGSTHLVAASPYGERLVGAALLLYADRLRGGAFAGDDAELSGHCVLVVDVNLASGTSMAHAARRARQSGALHVEGAVISASSSAVGPMECGLDGLAVLGSHGVAQVRVRS